MQKTNDKTQMSSKEVADYFGITTDTLRFYERKGVIPSPARDENGYRVYTDVELNWLYLALNLKRAGLSLEKITEFAQLARRNKVNSLEAEKQLLKEQISEIDKQLINLKNTRDVLQGKLDHFNDHLGKIGMESPSQKEWQDYKK